MTETTKAEESLSREEVADYLRSIAEEFEHSDTATVRIGNKQVSLTPNATINCQAAVTERSRLLGSNTETLELTLSWKPTGD